MYPHSGVLCVHAGVKAGLVRLLGNLVHRNRRAQDQALALGGVPLVLGCCRVEEGQPMLREWALLAVRNLTEGNNAVRSAIAELKARAVVATPELQQMGIKTELDDHGKLRVKVPAPPTRTAVTAHVADGAAAANTQAQADAGAAAPADNDSKLAT